MAEQEQQPEERSLAQWNAFVEAGADVRERRARLALVPADLRDAVAGHVYTVFALRDAARLSQRPAKPTP